MIRKFVYHSVVLVSDTNTGQLVERVRSDYSRKIRNKRRKPLPDTDPSVKPINMARRRAFARSLSIWNDAIPK